MGAMIKTALIEIARMAATLAAVYAFAVFFLSLESHAPQAPTVIGKSSPPPFPQSQPAALLSHPLDYSVSVRDCLPSGRGCTEYRYYAKERAHGR
jgi:hypothetical protein